MFSASRRAQGPLIGLSMQIVHFREVVTPVFTSLLFTEVVISSKLEVLKGDSSPMMTLVSSHFCSFLFEVGHTSDRARSKGKESPLVQTLLKW